MTPSEQQELMRRLDWIQKRIEFIYIFALVALMAGIAAGTYFVAKPYWGAQNAGLAAVVVNLAAGWIFHLGTKHGPSPGPD